MRILSFFVMVLVALFLPLWSFVFLAFVYGLFFTPYELLALALCIDAEFGDRMRVTGYLYTLSIAVILLCTVYIKPYLRFYQ